MTYASIAAEYGLTTQFLALKEHIEEHYPLGHARPMIQDLERGVAYYLRGEGIQLQHPWTGPYFYALIPTLDELMTKEA